MPTRSLMNASRMPMSEGARDVDDERAVGKVDAEALGGPDADDEAQVGAEHRADGDDNELHGVKYERRRVAGDW